MADKILVVYASKCGSTAETAEVVAEELRKAGGAVDVCSVADAVDVGSYNRVVLGTAVRMGKAISEAEDFVKQNRVALAGLPVDYFTLGITMKQDTAESREKAMAGLKGLRAIKEPDSVGLFAGKVDYSTIPAMWRFMAKRDKSGAMAEGDFRDWDEIRAWAKSLTHELVGASK